MTNDEAVFLSESNAIEGEYSKEAFADACKAWKYLMKQDVLTLPVILKTHKILMKSRTTITKKEKGVFRKQPVWIGGKEAMSHNLIESHLLMRFCLDSMRVSPKPDWKKLHVLYERIHPFLDGNGRTGRMFMNWTRVKRCNLPLLIIHEGKEQKEYYKWFK